MPGFYHVNLPAYNPGPQRIDFRPLSRGIQALTEGIKENRLMSQQKDIGTALAQGGYGEAADKAFGYGDLKTGLSLTQAEQADEDRDFNRNRLLAQDRRSAAADARSREIHGLKMQEAKTGLRDRLVKSVSGIAQMIRSETDPSRKAQMVQALINSNPRMGQELSNLGLDPANPDAAMDMILAEARGMTGGTPEYQATKYGVLRKDTGQITPYPQNASGVDPDRVKLEQSLRKEYADLSKNFRSIQEGADRVKVGASLNNGVGDLSLIFGYMKLLDPGSVVREGEFANAENAQGVPDRIRNVWNKIVSGERLNPTTRKEFVAAAQALANEQMQRQQRVTDQFQGIATDAGLAPNRIIMDFGANEPAPPPPSDGNTQPPPPAAVQMLTNDPSPEAMREFDEIFGSGAAQRALGR